MNTFQVIIEPGLQSAFICDRISALRALPGFKGLLVAADAPSAQVVADERAFHRRFAGVRDPSVLIPAAPASYGPVSGTTAALLRIAGAPTLSASLFPDAEFLGSELARVSDEVLHGIASHGSRHLVFLFADQILDSRWLDHVNLVNAHPGVLPYARGVGALEQIAASGDQSHFLRAAGATLHHMTGRIDVGPIVASRTLSDPLSFGTLAEMRAANFLLLFDLLAATAAQHCTMGDAWPAGITCADAEAFPLYKRRMRTPELQQTAERAYQAFKIGQRKPPP